MSGALPSLLLNVGTGKAFPSTRGPDPSSVFFGVDTTPQTIRRTDLTPKGVERVVAALKARDLVECAVMHDGSGAEGFVEFLQRFWSYVFCFKVNHHRGKLRLSGGIYR